MSDATQEYGGGTFDEAVRRSQALRADFLKNPARYRVLTGDRPTGPLHIGHYFGSLRNRVELQQLGIDTFIVIADYQVLTDRDSVDSIPDNVRELVLEQAPDERLARILLGPAVFLRRIGPRQQHPRLDVNQRRRHDEELPRHIKIHLLHQLDVVEVLLRDDRNRDVIDIQLALANQMEEKIERALEGIQLDVIGIGRRLEICVFRHGVHMIVVDERRHTGVRRRHL